MQLVKMLEKKNIFFDNPVTIAHTGITTDELLIQLHQLKPTGKFDWVTLLIGVNNQYRNYDLMIYENEFEELVNISISLAKKKNDVIVVSIPDWSYSPFAKNDKRTTEEISKQIDKFNAINKIVSSRVGVKYVDITDVSRNSSSDFFTIDQLHPSGKQYKFWAEKVMEKIN
jgi:lysophospholipase L1-like esterase